MNIKGKTAVVTGAFGGLGREIVNSLEKEGVTCILVDLEKFKTTHKLFLCDFSKVEEVEKLSKNLRLKYPKIDFLFNVAGVGIYNKLTDISIKEWVNSININLNAPFILTKGILNSLLKSESAVVINIGSGMGVFPTPGRVSYCATKFGLRGMSLSLSEEFKNDNISFVLMTLGSIMTNFGTGGIALRKKLKKEGKKYLDSRKVASEIIKIVKDVNRLPEYTIYPQGYDE